jgi:hypothetical protein
MTKHSEKPEPSNSTKPVLCEVAVKKRRNIEDCKFWKPRGKKTHYCSIDKNEKFKQCYGVCKQFCSRDSNFT